MSTTGKTGGDGGGDEHVPLDDEAFSPEEQAAIERMRSETPMPTQNEGGDPPAEGTADPEDGKPRPKQQADAGDGEADDDGEEVDEITIDGQGKAHDASGKYVPKSALLRVKEQRKADRDALASEREARAKLEGRLNVLTEIINTVPVPGDQKKDAAPANPWEEADVAPEDDLVGAFNQQKRRADWERRQREGLSTATAEGAKHQEIVRTYVADAKRLATDQIKKGEVVEVDGQQMPAFQAAYLHLIGQRHAMLEALGVADPAERDRRIASEEADLVEQAAKQRKSPAELIFSVAKAAGFKMPAKAAPANGKDPGKSQAQLAAEKKLDQVNAGMKATQSLSGKGGQPATGVSTAQIIAMDDESFDAFIGKLSEDQVNKLLGA
jgi:hypothetical protein